MSSNGPYREVQASCLAPLVPSSGPAEHGTRGPAHFTLPATVHPNRFVQQCLGLLGMVNVACRLYSTDTLY
jgi:hypothetical protein